jgi:uncharacterized protein YydD (DUF2326 family)
MKSFYKETMLGDAKSYYSVLSDIDGMKKRIAELQEQLVARENQLKETKAKLAKHLGSLTKRAWLVDVGVLIEVSKTPIQSAKEADSEEEFEVRVIRYESE